MSDDDDDARLTHNSKAAVDMATPASLKKPEYESTTPAKSKKKPAQAIDNIDEP